MMKHWFGSLVVIAALTGVARAQSAEAEALFRDGKRLMGEQKYAEACEAFAASQRLAPGAATKVNLADCREKNGQYASAWGLFREVVIETRDDSNLAGLNKVAKERAGKLEPRLSYLTISVPDESRVDGLVVTRNGVAVDAGILNRAIPVDGGTHEIAASAPAHETWSTKVTIANEGAKETVDVPKFKALPVVEEPPPDEPDPIVVTRPAPASSFTGRRKLALGVGAVGVLAIAGGGLLGWSARGLEDDAYALCPDAACDGDADAANALIDRAETRALYANISFGVGALGVIGGVVLWLTGAPVAVAPTSDGLAVAGTF